MRLNLFFNSEKEQYASHVEGISQETERIMNGGANNATSNVLLLLVKKVLKVAK